LAPRPTHGPPALPTRRSSDLPLRRRQEALLIALKPEHIHSGNSGLRHPHTKLRRHRAEILADHDRAVAVRFERDEPQEIVKRVGDRKSTRLNSSHVAISYAVF